MKGRRSGFTLDAGSNDDVSGDRHAVAYTAQVEPEHRATALALAKAENLRRVRRIMQRFSG